jgi:hypothetical protein
MTTMKNIDIEMFKVAGVDLRDGKEFEEYCAVEAKTSVEPIYSRLGFQTKQCEFIGQKSVPVNLNELYLGAVVAEKEAGTALQQERSDATDQETATPEPAADNAAPRKGMIINPEFEAAVKEMEAQHKAQEPPVKKKKGRRTKAELEAAAKKKNSPVPPAPTFKPAEEIELGVIDEARLRRKTQAALISYFAKHGADNLRPIIRATGNRVTESTLRDMQKDSTIFSIKHWVAVDKGLKSLALKEIKREEGADS